MANPTQFSIRRIGLTTAWAAVACWLIRVSMPARRGAIGPDAFNLMLVLGVVTGVTAIGILLRRGPGFAIASLPISFVVHAYVMEFRGRPLPDQLRFARDATIFLGTIGVVFLATRWAFLRWTRPKQPDEPA
jgi:hypothetical protein